MSTNILNGDLDTLENIIVDVNSYSLSARKHEEILDEIDNMVKKSDILKKELTDEVNSKLHSGEKAICEGYDKTLKDEKAKLKSVKVEREKAKEAGMRDRIHDETIDLKKANEELIRKRKEMFKADKVPSFCSNKLFYAFIYPQSFSDYIIFLAIMFGIFAVIPELLAVFTPIHAWGIILYECIVAIFGITIFRGIRNVTLLKHYEVIKKGRKIADEIESNKGIINKIKKGIRSDTSETMYNLGEFDDEIDAVSADIRKTEAEKASALEDFNKNVRPQIIKSIEDVRKPAIETLLGDIKNKRAEADNLAAELKAKRAFISSNYEAYLGQDFVTIPQLKRLEQIMRNGDAKTIGGAIDVYNNI